MTSPPEPLLCLWSARIPQPDRIAAWRSLLPPDTLIVVAAHSACEDADWLDCAGDPLSALHAVAQAHPQRDVVLADFDARLPDDGWRRLIDAAAAQPRIAVLSALGGAVAALDVLPGIDTDASEHATGFCLAYGERALFATTLWSPGLSYWRSSALREAARVRTDALPETVQGAVFGNLYAASPCAAGFPAEAPLPVRTLRARLASIAAAPGWHPRGRAVVLHVLHGWGGGAEHFVRDMLRADTDRAHLVLIARSDPAAQTHGCALALHHDLDAAPLGSWPLALPIVDTALRSTEYVAVIAQVIRDWNVGAILVSSLIGHSLDALRTGLPTAVCTHDYYPLWPILHADFGDPQTVWNDAAVRAAMARHDPRSPLQLRDADHWIALRSAYVAALLVARATMVSPCASVAANQQRIAPPLAALDWRTIPHGVSGWPDASAGQRMRATIAATPSDAAHPLRVLVLGRVQGGKGEQLLDALLPQLPEGVELILLGAGAAAMRWFGHDRVHVALDYDLRDLPILVAQLRPDLALLPVSVSETWSYTLSELWSLDVPVLATRIGSLAERIVAGVSGLLVAPNANAIAEQLLALRDDRSSLLALRAPPLPDLQSMTLQWRAALPALAQPAAPIQAASPERLRMLATELDLSTARAKLAGLSALLVARQEELDRRAEWGFDLDRQVQQTAAAMAEAQRTLEQTRIAFDQTRIELDQTRVAFGQTRIELEQARVAFDQIRIERDQTRIARDQQTARVATLEANLRQQNADALHLQRQLHEQHALYQSDCRDLTLQRDVAVQQRDRLQAQIEALLRSQSWRLMKPLRWLRRGITGVLVRAQFVWKRSGNALTRTTASLRRRGLRGTIARAQLELRGPVIAPTQAPQVPAADAFVPFALACADQPVASIVVPVYNHFEHTLTCLRALAASGDATGFEVIVVDDASSDETAQCMREIAGVRYHRNAQNLGFIGACNAGAALARGDYLVFLNNDTAVQPGWLDALIGTFDAHPRAGLVGAKLVYPDGRLQEAGGVVFRDASGWNYGRFDDPAAPAYNHVREADYCSGAAIALPRALFEKLGGFDALYTPAYYEDTDLAMKVHAEGLQVLYQPASTVVHFEGVTSGTDTGSGIKAYQVANQKKFLARWRDNLAAHPQAGGDIRRACDHRATRRVLVIDACTPMPDRDSGSLRLINLLALLREEGCAVDFFADNLLHDGRYTEALQQLGVQAWWNPWIRDVPGWFAEHGALFDTIIVSRHYVASNYLALARRYAPQARFVFDTVDLHYLREQREAEIADDPSRMRTAQQTRERELKLIRESDLTLVVSPVEQALLAREAPGAAVEVLSNVHRAKTQHAGFDGRKDIVFVGGYRHPPNVDAALWMAREIFPLIHARRDDIVLHLIGSDATDEVLALDELPGVRVHGHVPDLDPYMDGCRIGLAPLRYGAGVKGKVNLSMAHGQPVVATPAAVEGMHLRDGVDVLVGADTQAFADAVLRLYDDRVLWDALAHHGIENVERHFSFDAAREALRRVLG